MLYYYTLLREAILLISLIGTTTDRFLSKMI